MSTQNPPIAATVTVLKGAFGRFQMAAQIGSDILFHGMLFRPEHKARLDAQVERVRSALEAEANPHDALNPAFWYRTKAQPEMKRTVFKPKTT